MAEVLTPDASQAKIIQTKVVKSNVENLVEYEITVNAALQKDVYERLFANRAKDIEVKGFRKGEAPRTAVEPQLYNDLMKDLTNVLVNNAVEELIYDNNIVTLSMPEVENISLSMVEVPLKFTVKVQEIPEYKIPDTKKYAITVKGADADEKEIEDAFKNLWEDWKKRAKDEEKAKYTEATDEWVAETMKLPNAKNLADLKKLIKEELEHSKLHEQEEKQIGEALDKMMAEMKITVPEKVVKTTVEQTIASQLEKTKKFGLTWEDYLKQYGKTEEEFKKEVADSFEKQYKEEIFWTFYIRARNLKIDTESQDDAVFINYAAASLGIKTTDKLSQNDINRILRTAALYKALQALRVELGIKLHDHEMGQHDHDHADEAN